MILFTPAPSVLYRRNTFSPLVPCYKYSNRMYIHYLRRVSDKSFRSQPGATTDEPLANNSRHGLEYTKSFPCPVGYYCESGDIIPTPCPNKTYNPAERGERWEDCLPCQKDHYNHLTGMAACFHCGGQATQPFLRQDTCQCSGLNRVFMVSSLRSSSVHTNFHSLLTAPP